MFSERIKVTCRTPFLKMDMRPKSQILLGRISIKLRAFGI